MHVASPNSSGSRALQIWNLIEPGIIEAFNGYLFYRLCLLINSFEEKKVTNGSSIHLLSLFNCGFIKFD
uniref:Uncharacterized protein n=1 Tax=Onchocerca volvulus TaxID=6282 RepID=A0A8R1TVX0_ONCVO